MSLAEARDVFERDFACLIQQGASIKIASDSRVGTVGDLFAAYIQHLKDADKPPWVEAETGLNKVLDTLGRTRPARDIFPTEVVGVLRPIYERGARSMADHVRSYIRAAYSWGIKSEHTTVTRRRDGFSSFTIRQRV